MMLILMLPRKLMYKLVSATAIVALTACGSGKKSEQAPNQLPTATDMVALGKEIFFDQSLSASGRQSCGTCHVPGHAHAADDNFAVPLGGASVGTNGFRNAPSLNYLSFNPSFYFDKEGTPTGGFNRDGRADTLSIQAERPFLAAHEMANDTPKKVAEKLERAAYVSEFRRLFGVDIFDDPEKAFKAATIAIARYEQEGVEFKPFDSKFDYFIQGKVNLSAQELRGFALFNNPQKGNCAACHPSTSSNGTPPLFTDFTYDNLGVARNLDIPATSNSEYFDLGLCGPDRTDLTERSELCGAFKVPSLRNVAITAPYFHNGKIEKLEDAVRFYASRDTNPEDWYPQGVNGLEMFNDLPPQYRLNVNMTEAPYNLHLGDEPALDKAEITDLVEFLKTLTDGYQPQ
jgi:cytochrome c peroxidase